MRLKVLGDQFMPDDLGKALENMSSQDQVIRQQAFEVIHRSREKTVPDLLDVLRHKDGRRQDIALNILWELFREHGIRHLDLVPALVSAIRSNKDNNPLIVLDGIGFLSELKDSAAFDDLVMFIKDDDETLRVGAVEALGLLGDVRAVPFLITSLKDVIQDVRNRALWALGYIGDQNPALVEVIGDELHRLGTQEAFEAIKKLENVTKHHYYATIDINTTNK